MAFGDPLIFLNELHETEPMSEWSFGSKRAPRGNYIFAEVEKKPEVKGLNQFLRILKQKGEFPSLNTVITQGSEKDISTSA